MAKKKRKPNGRMRPLNDAEVRKYKQETGKLDRKFVIAFDNHGDMIDPNAMSIFFRFVEDFKPDVRIHGGDCFDFRPLRNKASADEQREGWRNDVEMGLDFLRRFNPSVWCRGNHDERLWDVLSGEDKAKADAWHGVYREIEEATPHCMVLPYHKRNGVYALGDLNVLHGYHSGMYAARSAASVYGNCVMGHVHTNDYYSAAALSPRAGRACGGLVRLDMDYNRGQANTLRQGHGWAYGIYHADGSTTVWQAMSLNGAWYLPSEMKKYA